MSLTRDESVHRFMGDASDSVEQEQERIREHIASHHEQLGFGLFIVVDAETGKPIGRAGVHHGPRQDLEELEVNYLIAEPWRGQGYATEVVQAVVDHVRSAHGVTRLAAMISADNAASRRVAEKVGFELVDEVDYPEIGRALRYVWTADSAG
jgi:RimJ/RimL family protein N-acetyltransferase